jgi:hypothetical protein
MIRPFWEPGVLDGSIPQQIETLLWHRRRNAGQLRIARLASDHRAILEEMVRCTDARLVQLGVDPTDAAACTEPETEHTVA